MLPNPYSPGETPRFLAGRTEQLAGIAEQTTRILQTGGMGGPLLVFTAPRGLGKTSLLRAAQQRARPEGFATAWVSCARNQPFLPDLTASVARALRDVEAAQETGWLSRLTSVGVELGFLGSKVSAEFATRQAQSAPAGAVTAIEQVLHQAARGLRERGGAGLVLMVDELHAPATDDLAVFLNAVQNLSGDRDRNPLAIIGAGLPSTPTRLTQAATFGERSSFEDLPRLGDLESATALLGPAADAGVAWDPAAVELVVASSRGYPYYLQLLGANTWKAAKPGRGDVITVAQVRAGAALAHGQMAAVYRARWEAATAAERQFITAMASSPLAPVPRAHIAAALGQTTQQVSVARDRLIEKGIIEPAGHGVLRFTVPGFERFVADQTDEGEHELEG